MKINLSRISHVEPERFSELKESNDSYLFMKSKFTFLNDHFGFRPGNIHLLLGTTGSGKSTLIMSLIHEMLGERKRILLYSAEEKVDDIATKFSYNTFSFDEKHLGIFHEYEVLSRLDDNQNDAKGFIQQLEYAIEEMQPEILIFDNITTSLFYDQNKNATEVAMRLKRLCEKTNIPFLIVAHTSSSIRDSQFFDSSCIRGFRSISNTSQYVYCYLRMREVWMGKERVANFIYTDKSRNHGEASRSSYRIQYDSLTKMFTSDLKIGFQEFKKFFKVGK